MRKLYLGELGPGFCSATIFFSPYRMVHQEHYAIGELQWLYHVTSIYVIYQFYDARLQDAHASVDI